MYNSNEPTVTAKNTESGETRDFTRTQWELLGEYKQGYKVATPAEADAAAAEANALQFAQKEYQAVTGKVAPEGTSLDFLRGVVSALRPAAPAAPAAPVAEQPAAVEVQAEAVPYKRPRSTEAAREMYAEVFGTDAAEDATFATLTADIEQQLGVAK